MLEYLIKDEIVKQEDRIAVGVSGGADSMLLLWALLDKQKKIGFYLKVINVNHHIRGKESDDDSLFVENFCKKRKIPYEIVEVDVRKNKIQGKITLEESARQLRYDAFFKLMKKDKLNKLFLAHHKNDQAETILMHLFRGSGILGACGIFDDGVIFRPLLNLKKSEILSLAKEHGIEFVTDKTNFENDCSRNYLRNIVFPEIEKIYPQMVDSIFSFGERCFEIQNFISSQINHNLIVEQKDFIVLKDEAFENPAFIVREYLRIVFQKLGIFADIEKKHVDLIFDLKKSNVNKMLNFPHGAILKRAYDGIKFCLEKHAKIESKEQEFVVGRVEIDGIGIIETSLISPEDVVYGNGSIYADYNKISNKAIWRTRRAGDVFSKLGTGSKKLNDYFTDKKIDNDKRDKIPVLAADNQIFVVANLDVSEKAKIDGTTEKIVKIDFCE